MKKFLLIFLFLTYTCFSAPIKNHSITLVQPNGDKVECFSSGDEYHNWAHDKDNFTIIQNSKTGYWVYAILKNGKLAESDYIVNKSNPFNIGLAKGINIKPEEMLKKREEKLQKRDALIKNIALKNKKKSETLLAPSKGLFNNIIIFIRFKDEEEFTDSLTMWEGLLNKNDNCMKNFFWEDSYQQLTINTHFFPLSNTTVLSFQDSLPREYYKKYDSTTNPNGYTSENGGIREITLLGKAADFIKNQVPTDLNIDADEDGFIDNVCFVVSGNNEAWADLLWPHMSFYDNSIYPVSINNKKIGSYNLQLRSWFNPDLFPEVLCHEMGHSIGFPDLYRYSTPGTPVGAWDMMAYNTGHSLAWMKYKYAKWITDIPVIEQPGYYSLKDLTSSTQNAFMIKSPIKPEFFILEYRKKQGLFESRIPDSGLLIYRVNTRTNGNAGGPPDEIYIYRPNGTMNSDGDVNQASFSLDNNRTIFNEFTNPYPFLSNGKSVQLNISEVGYCLDTITFAYNLVSANSDKLTLKEPLNNSENNSSNPKFVWYKNNLFEKYHLQVSDDINFLNLVFEINDISDSTKKIFGLENNKVYYWRVRQRTVKGLCDWSDIWSFKTNKDLSIIPLDSIIAYYPLNGNALDFSGNNHNGTLNNLQPAKDRFGYEASCMYFNGLASYIDIGAWNIGSNFSITGWVKYETFKDWSRFIDFGNGPGSSNILIANAGTSNDIVFQIYTPNSINSIYLANAFPFNEWVFIAATYSNSISKLYLNGNKIGEFNDNSVIDSIVRNNQFIGKSNWDNQYFNGWMDDIRIYQKELSDEEISMLYNEEPLIVQTPLVPVLHFPEDYSNNNSINVNFGWYSSDGAKYYQIQISENSDFSTTIYDNDRIKTDSIKIIGLEYLTKYYWRVRASNSKGLSNWSEIFRFSTFEKTIPPNNGLVAYYPFSGNANDVSGNNRNGEVFGAALSNDRFNSPNSAYYFDGFNSYIDIGAWALDTNFTICGWFKYEQFNNWSRIVDFGNGPASDNILIANQSNSSSIIFEIFKQSDAKEAVCNNVLTTNEWTFFTAVAASGSLKLYLNCKLIAINPDYWVPNFVERTKQYFGKSNWGSDQYFQGWLDDIRIYNRGLSFDDIVSLYNELGHSTQKLSQPVLINPSNNDNHSIKHPLFKWNDTQNANSYQIQVSENNDFSNIIAERVSIYQTSVKITPMEPNKTFFWHARSVNLDGNYSDWSETWNFVTFNQIPAKPLILSPIKNEMIQLFKPEKSILFSWNKATDNDETDIVKYTLYVINNDKKITVDNLTDTSNAVRIMQQLDKNTTYTFFINANDGYDNVFSDTSYFKTSNDVFTGIHNETIFENKLGQNYPNPLKTNTVISFYISSDTKVNISVYDIFGNLIIPLVNNYYEAGKYSLSFDLSALPDGIYYYRLTTDNFSDAKPMIIIK